MANIIIVFPKIEDVRAIRSLLVRSGYTVHAACTSGAQALAAADRLGSGVIISGYKFSDMLYQSLYEEVSERFEMLLIASARIIEEGICEGVVGVTMPLKVQELTDSLEMLLHKLEYRRKKRRAMLHKRSEAQRKQIMEAKALLMERNHMTEDEAHRYLQKLSMDSGHSLIETAEMLFALSKI